MPRMFDHPGLPVRNIEEARDWFRDALGLEIEFGVPEHKAVALKDGRDFAILLAEPNSYGIYLWDEASTKANG